MTESERWIVKCQDTKDGSGDIIVDLPPELLAKMGVGVGDDLAITLANGAIVLTPMLGTTSVRSMFAGVLRDDAYHAYHAYRTRLEVSLLIPTSASYQDIHYMIEAGFSASLVKSLGDVGTISPAERDRIIPFKALKTKLASNQLLTVSESDRLFRFVHIAVLADVIFGDAGKAKRWLSKPKSRFGGKSPIMMLSTTPGTHLVEEMLIQVAEGASV